MPLEPATETLEPAGPSGHEDMSSVDDDESASRLPRAHAVCGWGCYPLCLATEIALENLRPVARRARISCGLRRSYGDAALPAAPTDLVCNTTRADRFLAMDCTTGILRAEAGVSLRQLNLVLLPRGWFVPVTPGTQNVTLGGMTAADVHGKNHHVAGCFGEHVRAITLMVADGSLVQCSPTVEPELFWATVGGMGLTGHILEVEVQMHPVAHPWIYGESERVENIDSMIAGLSTAASQWPMTVGWIDSLATGDSLGRGILMKGRWATDSDMPPARQPRLRQTRSVPLTFPNMALARWNMQLFNTLYFHKHPQQRRAGLQPWERFFYPLDGLENWNRIYGRRGFTQYQCVFPRHADTSAMRGFLELFAREGGMSFLSVIKDCGPEGRGMLSFPTAGMSIALDFPVQGNRTQRLVDRLNEYVIAHSGRIYLAKDAFTRPEHFLAMDNRLDSFLDIRNRWDPHGRIRSALSVRLFGDRP